MIKLFNTTAYDTDDLIQIVAPFMDMIGPVANNSLGNIKRIFVRYDSAPLHVNSLPLVSVRAGSGRDGTTIYLPPPAELKRYALQMLAGAANGEFQAPPDIIHSLAHTMAKMLEKWSYWWCIELKSDDDAKKVARRLKRRAWKKRLRIHGRPQDLAEYRVEAARRDLVDVKRRSQNARITANEARRYKIMLTKNLERQTAVIEGAEKRAKRAEEKVAMAENRLARNRERLKAKKAKKKS